MTDRSPAAQAVLNAYRDKSWTPDEEDNSRYYKFSHKAGIAAALRAAADQVVPLPRLPYDSCCDVSASAIRAELLGIAAELECSG